MNVIGSTFTLLMIGMGVGQARKKYTEKAKENGDENAEERFNYPKLYAEGFSDEAKQCVRARRVHFAPPLH